MDRYFYPGCDIGNSAEVLAANRAFPLVRELNYTHGLQVFHIGGRTLDPFDSVASDRTFFMCHADSGLSVGMVYATPSSMMENSGPNFFFSSPFFKKERGKSRAAKETIHSKKVSSVMASIKKMSAIPLPENLVRIRVSEVIDAREQMKSWLEREFGSSKKTAQDISVTDVQALIARALEVQTPSISLPLDLEKCKKALDIMEAVDKIKEDKRVELERFFNKPLLQIGIDAANHVIVGKYRVTFGAEAGGPKHEMISPFKRYGTVEECEEIVPLMTMIKVAYEQKDIEKTKYGTPTDSGFDSNLDCAFVGSYRANFFDIPWIITPAGDA